MNPAWIVFINWNSDFVGKAAALAAKNTPPKQKLVTMVIDVDGIDVCNDEAILCDGKAVGMCLQAVMPIGCKIYGDGLCRLIMQVLAPRLQVEILGEFYQAEVVWKTNL